MLAMPCPSKPFRAHLRRHLHYNLLHLNVRNRRSYQQEEAEHSILKRNYIVYVELLDGNKMNVKS
jgi:hypothetical protein